MVACVELVGCGERAFVCESDVQCGDGWCEASGYCSFPDTSCPSGRRYGSLAPSHLAGDCVGQEDGTGTTSPQTGDVASMAMSSTSDAGDETTLALTSEAVTTSTSTTSEPEATSMGTEGSSSSGGLDGVWYDGFDRPDGEAIGNDWIEKLPTAWALADGQVVSEGDPLGYEDNIVYRPAEEDLRDLSVSLEFMVLAADPNNHTQVHLRLQHEDLEVPLSVTGYILYVVDPYLSITRQIGGSFDGQWNVDLTSPVVPGERYRLTFSAVGEDPVQLVGLLEIETDAGWETHTMISHDDADPQRIATPGTWGFSGADMEQIPNIVYDDFTRLDLSDL